MQKSQLDRIEEYFGAHAGDWEDLYGRPRQVNDLVLADRRRIGVDRIRRHVAPGGRVLDAGCGAGLVALDLVRQGFFVQGVDIAQDMLELCERRFAAAGIARDRYVFSRADVSRTGLAPGSFGGVMALGFLEYQDDERAALEHFHSLLEPGGALVVSGPTDRKLANYLGASRYVKAQLARRGLVEDSGSPARLALRGYSLRGLQRKVELSGFEILERLGHGFVEFEGIASRLSYSGQVRLHRILSWLATFLPIDQWGNNLVVVARKPR